LDELVPGFCKKLIMPFAVTRNIMEQIRGSAKRETGIEISWAEQGKEQTTFFSYQEIIDMKINAVDLLENPRFYLIDSKANRIHATSRGCCET
jgi:hypothetical protein